MQENKINQMLHEANDKRVFIDINVIRRTYCINEMSDKDK